jgi:hypothetical protein
MFRSVLVVALALMACQPALPAELRSHERQWRSALPPERHVIEVVRPPYSGSFIINGAAFTAKGPVCWNWTAGERVTLIAGEWHGWCTSAVFYNLTRRRSCDMWCF